jgi:hypothetical protein
LRDLYQVYLELRSRRKARKATRRIAKISKLPLRRKSHPIRILIEASVGPEDARQKSRWVQALKYVDGWQLPPEKVRWCFNENGGIAGCARKYAINRKAARRKNYGCQNSNIIHQQSGLGEIPKLNTAIRNGSKP